MQGSAQAHGIPETAQRGGWPRQEGMLPDDDGHRHVLAEGWLGKKKYELRVEENGGIE